jgi:hypothetical protein
VVELTAQQRGNATSYSHCGLLLQRVLWGSLVSCRAQGRSVLARLLQLVVQQCMRNSEPQWGCWFRRQAHGGNTCCVRQRALTMTLRLWQAAVGGWRFGAALSGSHQP